ncbi:putative transcription factor bHLH041 [Abrus precatorius]|uniref:Transcription factor bHLH041 n=1 Tax=Abrus precatorius TaxID=3816 RepID=A0A8B8JQQ8_ABRPR|nr:putative transcription factor bHLH041 [Abrus precatorius]
MDGVFALPQAARTDFLRSLVHSFGCAYVCLWRHDSDLYNRLFFLDGFYNVTNNQLQPSTSLGSTLAKTLFHQYQRLTFDVNDDCVPGVAFRNHLPYLELQQLDLLRLSSTEIQKQFIEEARIMTAVFMGCNKGEIELGFSYMSQGDIQRALWSLFPEDFSTHCQSIHQKNPPSSTSSSSSFISLSTGSPEITLGVVPAMPTTQTSPQQQRMEPLAQVIPSHFPTPEGEDDALIRAFLHVISSPSSSTSQQHQPQQNLPDYTSVVRRESTAFKRYRSDVSTNVTPQMGSNFQRQSLLNRSFSLLRSLNFVRMREPIHVAPPTGTQLNHIISERRRREKLNESFQALGAILPPGTKKDKASILTTAKETMKSLMDEIEKLYISNQQLMTFLSEKGALSTEENIAISSNERFKVEVSDVLESSSSEGRMVDLQVISVRGESSQVDILIRLLRFLERLQNVSLISMAANNHITQRAAINQLTFRLRILEGSEWDEPAFLEAVRRVVDDLVQCQVDQSF